MQQNDKNENLSNSNSMDPILQLQRKNFCTLGRSRLYLKKPLYGISCTVNCNADVVIRDLKS
jgi:hypothetical protein